MSEKLRSRNKEYDNAYNKRYRTTTHGIQIVKRLRLELPTAWKIYYRAKRRALTGGLDFDLDKSDIIIPKFCPITNLELIENKGKGFKDNSPSLDRIDNSKGYIKNNVAVISMRANKCKSNLSLEEISKLFEYSTRNKKETNDRQ